MIFHSLAWLLAKIYTTSKKKIRVTVSVSTEKKSEPRQTWSSLTLRLKYSAASLLVLAIYRCCGVAALAHESLIFCLPRGPVLYRVHAERVATWGRDNPILKL